MTQYNTLNANGDCNDKTNFLHKLLLTDTQVLRLHKAFPNHLSVNQKPNCLRYCS